ncbi:hypothetical protein NMQ01_06355 [Janibacter sp. CX7]|uniref:glycosyltransferase n=1 Tax=Janibacter sp. CX7 TaxID=2963431 RepID=UPI0020CF11F2|nr:glycosyltransferase [Janibacter sp. CX7]UTT67332.1 hypothetical protein NMQ01_06355 [Janibacter sp. CX7]
MIGYYIHHHGSGHLHRARAVAASWGSQITGLSSLPRPADWPGEWVRLEDDAPVDPGADVTAGGHLHWVPRRHPGLGQRMGALSAWLVAAKPRVLVCDVSVEVAVLARLHGVPVVTVVQPGERSDDPHLLGYGISDALVALWPETADIRTGLPLRLRSRIRYLGGLSRFPATAAGAVRDRSVAVLWGRGGGADPERLLEAARAGSAGWTWTMLGGQTWSADPFAVLSTAEVVITHAGQNAVAETAAARRPAVVIPQIRPFWEQHVTARALRAPRWPATVLDTLPRRGWTDLLERTAGLDGSAWSAWCDDRAASRFVQVVREVAAA